MRARQLPSSRQVAIGPMKAGDIRATPVGKVRRTTCSSQDEQICCGDTKAFRVDRLPRLLVCVFAPLPR